jgi:hypothetical protein
MSHVEGQNWQQALHLSRCAEISGYLVAQIVSRVNSTGSWASASRPFSYSDYDPRVASPEGDWCSGCFKCVSYPKMNYLVNEQTKSSWSRYIYISTSRTNDHLCRCGYYLYDVYDRYESTIPTMPGGDVCHAYNERKQSGRGASAFGVLFITPSRGRRFDPESGDGELNSRLKW